MKNITRHKGKLEIIQRLPHSYNGNPRFLVRLDGWTCKTKIDSSLGYSIQNMDGNTVTAELGSYYGSCHIENVRRVEK
jgi:hypothetical protein